MLEVSFVHSLRRSAVAAYAATAFAATAFVCLICAPARAEVPACFVSPPDPTLAVSAKSGTDGIACTLLAKLLQASDEADLAWIPGAMLNKTLNLSPDAFPNAAYAVRFVVTAKFNSAFAGSDSLVRFAPSDFAARVGSWWTVLETVTDRSGQLENKAAIVAQLALPPLSVPSFEAKATQVRVGTVGYFGLVASAFTQPGGGVQFWFPSEPVYSTTKMLP